MQGEARRGGLGVDLLSRLGPEKAAGFVQQALHVPPCTAPHRSHHCNHCRCHSPCLATHAASAETIKLLVEAGGDPLLSSGRHQAPLEMAANQGNAE